MGRCRQDPLSPAGYVSEIIRHTGRSGSARAYRMLVVKLIIGCPVANRDWVLPLWWEHLKEAIDIAGVDASLLFGVPVNDPSLDVIDDISDEINTSIIWTADPSTMVDHDWRPERYKEMARLRNLLLERVNSVAPDAYLSLDSDILLQPTALRGMIELLGKYDAVGSSTNMVPLLNLQGQVTASKGSPSYFNRNSHNVLIREPQELGTIMQVDVIMAAKLMSPEAYAIPYGYNAWGEDVAWSDDCTAAGLKLGWDNRTVSRHVMRTNELEFEDPRVA